jgi:hypothetical protein
MSTLKIYKAYNFRTKDPVIDELRTIAQDAYGKLNHKALADIERSGGPSASCMSNWFFGKTRRPQSASTEAAGRAMGFKRKWVKLNGAGR